MSVYSEIEEEDAASMVRLRKAEAALEKILAACDCAEAAPGHSESPAAVECLRVVRLWCEGRTTINEVHAARTVR